MSQPTITVVERTLLEADKVQSTTGTLKPQPFCSRERRRLSTQPGPGCTESGHLYPADKTLSRG